MAGILATSTLYNSIQEGYPTSPNSTQLLYGFGSLPLFYFHPASKGIASILAKGYHLFYENCHEQRIKQLQKKAAYVDSKIKLLKQQNK